MVLLVNVWWYGASFPSVPGRREVELALAQAAEWIATADAARPPGESGRREPAETETRGGERRA